MAQPQQGWFPEPLGVPGDTSDADLVTRSLRGDRGAFAALFDRHAPRLNALARYLVSDPTDAEDVIQETFLQALSSLPALRQPDSFGAWITRIATNVAMTMLRQRGRFREVGLSQDVVETYPDSARWSSPEALGLAAEDRDSVRVTLDRLAPSQRAALALREIGGLSYREIAEQLSTTPGSVEVLLFRARARFRDEYEKVSLGAAPPLPTACRQTQRLLGAFVDDELTAPQRRQVIAHLNRCRTCMTVLQLQRATGELMAVLPVALPSALKAAMLSRVGPLLSAYSRAAATGATCGGAAGVAASDAAGGTMATAGTAAGGTTATAGTAGAVATGCAVEGTAVAGALTNVLSAGAALVGSPAPASILAAAGAGGITTKAAALAVASAVIAGLVGPQPVVRSLDTASPRPHIASSQTRTVGRPRHAASTSRYILLRLHAWPHRWPLPDPVQTSQGPVVPARLLHAGDAPVAPRLLSTRRAGVRTASPARHRTAQPAPVHTAKAAPRRALVAASIVRRTPSAVTRPAFIVRASARARPRRPGPGRVAAAPAPTATATARTLMVALRAPHATAMATSSPTQSPTSTAVPATSSPTQPPTFTAVPATPTATVTPITRPTQPRVPTVTHVPVVTVRRAAPPLRPTATPASPGRVSRVMRALATVAARTARAAPASSATATVTETATPTATPTRAPARALRRWPGPRRRSARAHTTRLQARVVHILRATVSTAPLPADGVPILPPRGRGLLGVSASLHVRTAVPAPVKRAVAVATKSLPVRPARPPIGVPTRVLPAGKVRLPSALPTRVPVALPTRLPAGVPTVTLVVRATPLPALTPPGMPSLPLVSRATPAPAATPASPPAVAPPALPPVTPVGVPALVPTRVPSAPPVNVPTVLPSLPTVTPPSVPTLPPSVPTVAPPRLPTIVPTATPIIVVPAVLTAVPTAVTVPTVPPLP